MQSIAVVPIRTFAFTHVSYIMSFTYKNPEIDNPLPGTQVLLPLGFGPIPDKNKRIFFFDIDNCLYNKSTKIHDMMQVKIHDYFKSNLNLNDQDAHELHMNYYKTYGLALEGLVRNHKVDALKYNEQVDDSLDLKAVLHYNQQLRDMLSRIRQSGKFDYFWLLTNAYKNHALRVISFLGIGDLFDGLTYCDYSTSPIICKPMTPFFDRCLEITNVDKDQVSNLYFVDDSEINVKAAKKLGWGHVFHYVETDSDYEKLIKSNDFEELYTTGNDPSKIKLIRNILDIETSIEL